MIDDLPTTSFKRYKFYLLSFADFFKYNNHCCIATAASYPNS